MPMANQDSDGTTPNEFDEALWELSSSNIKGSNKQEILRAKNHVQTICKFAYQRGLPTLALGQLLDTVTGPNNLDQGSRMKITKSLYPATKVTSDQICIVVSSLGQGSSKASLALQDLLLKWIIMVHEILEEPSILSNLYSVFFNMLDMLSLRAHLCHLLAVITRRKHVKPFRIQYLEQLFDSVGREPALAGLIKVFDSFCAITPFSAISKGRFSNFSHPDPAWRDQLQVIQQASNISIRKFDEKSSSFKVIRRGSKRICESDGSEIPKSSNHAYKSPTTLEAIHGVDDFINNLELIKLSPQILSAIDDPLLQRYLILGLDENAITSIEEWLASSFEEQLSRTIERQPSSRKLSDIFLKLLSYTRYTKTLPKPAEAFFQQYLTQWNGKDNRDVILNLLSYAVIRPFEELQSILFNPLEAALLDNTAASSIALLDFYTTLLRHWTARLLSTHPTPTDTSHPPSPPPNEIAAPLLSLSTHAFLLLLTIQTAHSSTKTATTIATATPITSSLLTYLESLTFLISHAPSQPSLKIPIPHPLTIYLLTFTPSLPALARLCAILATYKLAFEATLTRPAPPTPTPAPTPSTTAPAVVVPRHTIAHFNGFLMDVCNLLWRSRAFNTSDTNALGCLLPSPLLGPLTTYTAALGIAPHALSGLFSLSCNPVLAGLSIAAWRELEDRRADDGGGENAEPGIKLRHAGPVSQKSLALLGREGGVDLGWKDYRVLVLRWLADRGVGGVGELMGCTMKGLMGKEGGVGV